MKIYNLFFLVFIINSCVKNNPPSSWLKVNKWELVSNPNLSNEEGELTHNISNAWVYVDDELIGVFQVPFKIPILKSGNVNIKVYPTILNNGISATKKIYPFLEVYEINTILKENDTTILNPVTRYKNSLNFWIEDFEDASLKILNDQNTLAKLEFDNIDSILKWGNSYGKVILNEEDSTWAGFTNSFLDLPRGKEVYLEIDYYNIYSVTTGLITVSPNEVKNNQYIKLNSQQLNNLKWKKIYIDLREIVSNSNQDAYFELSFLAKNEQQSGFIIFDNIKIIHF